MGVLAIWRTGKWTMDATASDSRGNASKWPGRSVVGGGFEREQRVRRFDRSSRLGPISARRLECRPRANCKDASMNNLTSPRRRSFQFSIGTLIIASIGLTAVAVTYPHGLIIGLLATFSVLALLVAIAVDVLVAAISRRRWSAGSEGVPSTHAFGRNPMGRAPLGSSTPPRNVGRCSTTTRRRATTMSGSFSSKIEPSGLTSRGLFVTMNRARLVAPAAAAP